jgi:hypothetical protein
VFGRFQLPFRIVHRKSIDNSRPVADGMSAKDDVKKNFAEMCAARKMRSGGKLHGRG